MRIISKFHDYYDALNDGSDTDHVWKRETSSFLPDLQDPFFHTDNWENSLPHLMHVVSVPKRSAVYSQGAIWRGDTDEYRRSLLLFCGTFYPFVRLPDQVCWDFHSFAEAVRLAERPYSKHGFLTKQKDVQEQTQAMFTQETILPRFRTLNLRYRCPILLMDIQEQPLGPVREHEPERFRVRFTLNPRLADLDFALIIPPFEAFQRLEGYLFNELAEQNDPPVEISDTVRRDSHGFDKYSFRKEPSCGSGASLSSKSKGKHTNDDHGITHIL